MLCHYQLQPRHTFYYYVLFFKSNSPQVLSTFIAAHPYNGEGPNLVGGQYINAMRNRKQPQGRAGKECKAPQGAGANGPL
jgi:hypothetical protein